MSRWGSAQRPGPTVAELIDERFGTVDEVRRERFSAAGGMTERSSRECDREASPGGTGNDNR